MANEVVRFQAIDGSLHATREQAEDADRFENFRKEAAEVFCLPQSRAWQARQQMCSSSNARLGQAENPYLKMDISLRDIWFNRRRLCALIASCDSGSEPKAEDPERG